MKKTICSALVSGLFLATQVSMAATEVARVNDRVITMEDVNSKLLEASRGNPMAAPSKKQILDELIKREAAVQEAKKMKLDQDPAVQDRMSNVLYYALIEKKLSADFDKISFTESDTKNWYEKNPEIRTSHIFISLPQGVSADEESKAEKRLGEILAEVKSGKFSFAEAAQQYSEDPSAPMGGDLDYRMKDRLDPAFFKAAIKLGKVGDIAGPIRTPFGFHLVRLTGKRSWLEVDRARVKRLILEERRQDLVTRFLNDLRQKAKVSTNDKALKD
jgi:parvulin-like peptidyl-prolyl isomerase